MKLSVVVPCYNEKENIGPFFEKFMRCREAERLEAELVFVDNGSTDGTGEAIDRALAKAGGFIKKVPVTKNVGYGHGIRAGLRAAGGDVLAWTHADLQTDPQDVFRAYRVYENRAQKGRRIFVKGRRIHRRLSEKSFSVGMQLLAGICLGVRLSEINAQPKLFPRALYEKFSDRAPDDFSLDLYALWLARRERYEILSVPVDFGARRHGVAKGGGGGWRAKMDLIRRTAAAIFRLRGELKGKKCC